VIDVAKKEIVETFHYYLKPVIKPTLFPFCTELTGITQDKVDKGISLTEALEKLDKFLEEKNILKSRWVFVTCGDWDLKTCLPNETKFKKIKVKEYFKQWINLKISYPAEKGKRVNGMTDLLDYEDLDLVGRHHSGIDDTVNIARVAISLLKKGFIFTKKMIRGG